MIEIIQPSNKMKMKLSFQMCKFQTQLGIHVFTIQVIFTLEWIMNAKGSCWWRVNISYGNGLVQSGNIKP